MSNKSRFLAHDGPHYGAYLMVKGKDPVVHGVKHSFYDANAAREEKADSGMLSAGLYLQNREKHQFVAEEVYFHPPHLTQVAGAWVPDIAQVIHHHPGTFMAKIMKGL